MLPRLGRALLLLAFLLAQQSALAHQVWHLGSDGSRAALDSGAKGNPLCDQHRALDSVLGALGSAPAIASVVDAEPAHFPAADSPATRFASLSPDSRGPPASL